MTEPRFDDTQVAYVVTRAIGQAGANPDSLAAREATAVAVARIRAEVAVQLRGVLRTATSRATPEEIWEGTVFNAAVTACRFFIAPLVRNEPTTALADGTKAPGGEGSREPGTGPDGSGSPNDATALADGVES